MAKRFLQGTINSTPNYINGELVNNERVLGELSQDVIERTYTGVDTESVRITVDNDKRTISAIVNWDAFLGTTFNKAYPGNKGERDYQLILKLQGDLQEEIKKAAHSRNFVESAVALANSKLIDLTKTIDQKIETEARARIAQDSLLSDTISAETKRATKAEKDLANKILAEVKSMLSSISDASDKIEYIDSKLSQHINSNERTELEQNELIQDLQTALQNTRSEFFTRLYIEVQSLKNSDYDLDSKIDSIQTIVFQLSQETSNKFLEVNKQLEETTNEIKDDLESIKNNLNYVPIISNDGYSTQLYAQQGSTVLTIPVSESIENNSVVKRTAKGHILVSSDITNDDEDAAASVKFVKSREEKLKGELADELKYDFIDGGNAFN